MHAQRSVTQAGGLALFGAIWLAGCGGAAAPTTGAVGGNEPAAALATAASAPATEAAAAGATGPAALALPDPCTLLTTDEVNAAVGQALGDGQSSSTLEGMMGAIGQPLICTFAAARAPSARPGAAGLARV
jgi:hypothetical protein